MVGRFKLLPHTADVLLEAEGDTLEEAFEYIALAMFEVMTDTSKVSPSTLRNIETLGFDVHSLLYNWLEELLYYFDTEGLLFSKFKVSIEKTGSGYKLSGNAWGEEYDPNKHESRAVVKAATYHMMEIRRQGNKYLLRAVVDI